MELQDPFRWPPESLESRIHDSGPGSTIFRVVTWLWIPLNGINKSLLLIHHYFFFIRTSNFGAQADRSYTFLLCEAENVLKMFLNLQGIILQ